VIADPDLGHAEVADDAERGQVPRERGGLDRTHLGLGQGPVDARPRALGGQADAARLGVDAVADLGHTVGGLAMKDDAADDAPRALARHQHRVAPQALRRCGADGVERHRERARDQVVVGPVGGEGRADQRLGGRLVLGQHGQDQLERDRHQLEARRQQAGHRRILAARRGGR
jgi:hypothetical protein